MNAMRLGFLLLGLASATAAAELRGEVARLSAKRAASRRSQTSRENRMWSDLAPNYKGKQTFGLEMER